MWWTSRVLRWRRRAREQDIVQALAMLDLRFRWCHVCWKIFPIGSWNEERMIMVNPSGFYSSGWAGALRGAHKSLSRDGGFKSAERTTPNPALIRLPIGGSKWIAPILSPLRAPPHFHFSLQCCLVETPVAVGVQCLYHFSPFAEATNQMIMFHQLCTQLIHICDIKCS